MDAARVGIEQTDQLVSCTRLVAGHFGQGCGVIRIARLCRTLVFMLATDVEPDRRSALADPVDVAIDVLPLQLEDGVGVEHRGKCKE